MRSMEDERMKIKGKSLILLSVCAILLVAFSSMALSSNCLGRNMGISLPASSKKKSVSA